MQSRRSFLRTSALGLGAAGLLSATGRAQPTDTAAPAVPASGPALVPLVDWHSHVITTGELRLLASRSTAPRVYTDASGKQLFENVTTVSAVAGKPSAALPSDLDTRVKHLDENGVRQQLLTYTVALGYDATLSPGELRPFYRTLNDDLASILQKYPGRFLGVAAVPTADPVWAAEELKRAHRDLGLIGVALPLNVFSSVEGAKTQAPLFQAAQAHNSHVFVHRAPASPTIPGQPPLIIPSDLNPVRWSVISNTHLTNGALTLALSDFLDPYPDVSVQVIMLGGFFPYLLDSIIASGRQRGVADPLARLRRIYLEPGPYSSTSSDWVAYAAKKFGADRILFGTDYGVGGGTSADRLKPSIAALDRALTREQQQLIYVDNTRALLKAKGIAS